VDILRDSGAGSRLCLPVRGQVHLWWASFAAVEERQRCLFSWLSEGERRRADRLRTSRARFQRAASRGLLRALLAGYAGTTPDALRFAENPAGKPRLVEPATGLRFSVSHSGDLWICAVTDDQPVGIDVEQVRPLSSRHVIPFLAPEERAAWEDAFGPDREAEGMEALFALWTRKEAYVKARGLGLHLPLDAFAVTTDPDLPPRLRRDDHDPGAPSRWAMKDLDHFPGMRGALAMLRPLHGISVRALSA
jgi:4'-phosphopantetheinyl transferase